MLQRLAADADYAPAGWSVAEVDHFRLVAECADSAITVQDLRAMRCLRLQPGPDDFASVSLSATCMLTIKFETSGRPTAVFGLATVGTGQ